MIDQDSYNSKYSVYYDSAAIDGNPNGSASKFQFEMYGFSYDPASKSWDDEASNLLDVDGGAPASAQQLALWQAMHGALTARLQAEGQMPEGWPISVPIG